MFRFLPLLFLILSAFMYEVWGLPVVWLVIVVAAWLRPVREALWWGFLAGIIMASLSGNGWGLKSLMLIGIVTGVWALRRFLRIGGEEIHV